MKTLNEKEGKNVKFLNEKRVNFCLVQLTETILTKSLFDATTQIRAFLKNEGIHDFEHQQNGQDYKVLVKTHILTFSRSIDTDTSLYRAGARGDERMWFGSPILDVAQPDDIYAIFSKEHELYLINITKMDIESAWKSSFPTPVGEFIAYQIEHPSVVPDLFSEPDEEKPQIESQEEIPETQPHLEAYSTNFQPEEESHYLDSFRMTNLKAGDSHRFIVLGTCRNRKDEPMFEVVLPNDPYNNTYRVFPLRCQDVTQHPDEVVCYVKRVDERGRVWLEQDEYAFLASFYLPNQIYSFKVEKEIENTQTDKHLYQVRSEFNLVHVISTPQNVTHAIGDQVLCMVSIKRGDHNNAIAIIHVDEVDGEFFSPKDVFEGCNHMKDYEKYFESIETYRARSQKLSETIDNMNQKIETYNRLWIFDFCKALNQLSITSSRENLDEIEAINNLLHDVEIWMLEESGLMAKFSPEKREDTRIKSEQVIRRTEVITRAIQIIREGKQVEYLENVLAKLRKSSYLRNREQEFETLYSLISLQQDFLKENMVAFSELIDFTSREFIDTYITERIVLLLSSIIKSEKKRINTELHFLRSKDTDTRIFSDLIIGIGTLLNFRAKNKFESEYDFEIRTRSLFQELCKYLSLMAQKEDAIILINKAIEASVLRAENFEIKSRYLRELPQNPQLLIDYVKSMQFGTSDKILKSIGNNVCAVYKDGAIYVSHIPNDTVVNQQIASNIVYTIPGTAINVSTLAPIPKWKENQSISYYKKQWKDLLSGVGAVETPSINEEPASNLIPIKTHHKNKVYPNLMFCAGDTALQHLSGAISFQGYLPGVWLGCKIIEIFEEGLNLMAEPIAAENGKINFSVTANIKDYSNYLATQTDKVVNGVFISYLENEDRAVFITENGIICEVETTERNQYRLNWTYELVVSSKTSADSFPTAVVLKEANCKLDKKVLLRKQLLALSLHNTNTGALDVEYTRAIQLPYLHLLIDNYVRLFRDTAALYNVYHTARLFAILEQSTLADYYSSCIQYLEMVDGFSAEGPQDSSIPDFNWDDQLLSMFPSLQAHTEMYNLLKNFGSENDVEYLYRLSTRAQVDETISKLARISLAASLVEDVTDDEQLISMLRGLVAKTLGGSVEKSEPILAEAPIDKETEKTESDAITNYGVESQVVEFKTSIVYPAGTDTNEPNLDEQMNVIMRTIDGFLNARGGTIFIGVRNDGTPSGIEPDLRALDCNIDKYERIIRDRIVREFNKDVNGTIDIAFAGEANCRICRIHIPAYVNAIDYRGEFFQRQGNEVRILKGNDLIMFIRRRLEGKEIILDAPAAEPVPDLPENLIPQQEQQEGGNRSTADSTMTTSINPQYDNNQSFDLYFYKDGSCQLGYYLPEDDAVACIAIDASMKNMYIIQCYNNGCVNKMPVRNLYNMQFDYRYKNGLYKDAVLQKVMIISNEDYVLITSRQQTNRYLKLYPIWDISAHASLGLRGNQLLSQNYEVVEGWYLVHKEEASNCEKLITTTRSNLGWKLLSPSIRKEVVWLNNNIFNNM